jgi:hypothetical protein
MALLLEPTALLGLGAVGAAVALLPAVEADLLLGQSLQNWQGLGPAGSGLGCLVGVLVDRSIAASALDADPLLGVLLAVSGVVGGAVVGSGVGVLARLAGPITCDSHCSHYG